MKRIRPFIVGLVFSTVNVHADDIGVRVFDQGRTRLNVSAGIGSAKNGEGKDETYGIIGVGAGYYILKGLEAGLDGDIWLGKPRIYRLSPGLRYTLLYWDRFYPYMGAFYRRAFYDGHPDLDFAGGRAGVSWAAGQNIFLSGGLVYEKQLSCNNRYADCESVYPELGVGFYF